MPGSPPEFNQATEPPSASDTTQHPPLKIMLVAGEASGDKHGAALARALSRMARVEMFGSGGDEMRAAGVETLVDAREVAIIGIPEIARSFNKLLSAFRKLKGAALTRRPDVVVLIDWPEFNIRLARNLHQSRLKVVYYVSPQVWAWRRYRVRALRRYVDRMLVILPFEEEFFRNAGVEVEYVGHPLCDVVKAEASRQEFAARHGVDPARPLIALLPGSRYGEVHYHLPAMLEAAGRLRIASFATPIGDFRLPIVESGSPNSNSEIRNRQSAIADRQSMNPQFLIAVAPTIDREWAESRVREKGAGLDIAIVENDTYNALAHSEIAVVASGTATVEAALLGTPLVVIYRGSELSWRLIRPLIKLDTFGMVNLIAGRRIAPELMQHDVTGEKIAREVSALLGDSERLALMKRNLAEVRERLASTSESASERAARAVVRAAESTRK